MSTEDSIKAELKRRCDVRQGWACSLCRAARQVRTHTGVSPPPLPPNHGPASFSVHWALSAPTAKGGGRMEDEGQECRAHASPQRHLYFSSPLELSLWPHRGQMGREEGYPTSFQGETLPASVNSLPEYFQLLQAQAVECP